MQQDRTKRLEKMVNSNVESTKRTTIILDKDERDFIDQMIRDGKEPGIKPLISKMLGVYKNLMIHDWRFPGEYYYGISRIAFVNVELINILFQQIPKEKWGEIGKEMGIALQISIETILGLEATKRENWENVFKKLRVQGFGNFYLKDKYILLKTPFIGYPKLWEGILEGLLDVELDVKTSVPPLVFEIKTQKSVTNQ